VNEKKGTQRERQAASRAAERWTSIVQNEVENMPLGLIAAWSSLLFGTNNPLHVALVTGFTVSRFAHSYFYATRAEPYRTMTWMVSMLSTLGLLANGLSGVL
jgi:uncharacterized MAPEG superfamily protein